MASEASTHSLRGALIVCSKTMLRKGTRGELNLCHACFRGRASQLCHYTPCGEANARMAGNRRKGALVCQHKRRHCARRHWLRGARTLLRGRVALSPVPWLSPVADSSSRIAWNVYSLVLQRRWPSTLSKNNSERQWSSRNGLNRPIADTTRSSPSQKVISVCQTTPHRATAAAWQKGKVKYGSRTDGKKTKEEGNYRCFLYEQVTLLNQPEFAPLRILLRLGITTKHILTSALGSCRIRTRGCINRCKCYNVFTG